jgi:CheY-like chemotaxis protein
MNILLLDDNSHRITFFQNNLKKYSLVVCRHANAAIKALKKTPFDVVFLDHDLEGEPADPQDTNCGSEVARFIVKNRISCGRIILHTENRAGRESMEAILGNCESIPYSKQKKANFHNLLEPLITSKNL